MSSGNPFSHSTGVVEKIIGSAYDTVKIVADYMDAVRAVADALEEGPINLFKSDLSHVKASDPEDKILFHDGSIWMWETVSAPYTADDISVIKSNGTALTVGAWVRKAFEPKKVEITAVNNQTVFEFGTSVMQGHVAVYINGIRIPSANYTLVGTTVVLETGVNASDIVIIEGMVPTVASTLQLLDRENHTGTQPISTVEGLQENLDVRPIEIGVESALSALTLDAEIQKISTIGKNNPNDGGDATYFKVTTGQQNVDIDLPSNTGSFFWRRAYKELNVKSLGFVGDGFRYRGLNGEFAGTDNAAAMAYMIKHLDSGLYNRIIVPKGIYEVSSVVNDFISATVGDLTFEGEPGAAILYSGASATTTVPSAKSISSVDTSEDMFSVSSWGDPLGTGPVTGYPIKFAGSVMPTGITAGVTYYAVRVSATQFKVATTALNAINGVVINLTNGGSGVTVSGALNQRLLRFRNSAGLGGLLTVKNLELGINRPAIRASSSDVLLIEGFRGVHLEDLNIPVGNNCGITLERSDIPGFVTEHVYAHNIRVGGRYFFNDGSYGPREDGSFADMDPHSHGPIGDTALWFHRGAREFDISNIWVHGSGDDGIYLGPSYDDNGVARDQGKFVLSNCHFEYCQQALKLAISKGVINGLYMNRTAQCGIAITPVLDADGMNNESHRLVMNGVQLHQVGWMQAGEIGTLSIAQDTSHKDGIWTYGDLRHVDFGRVIVNGCVGSALNITSVHGVTSNINGHFMCRNIYENEDGTSATTSSVGSVIKLSDDGNSGVSDVHLTADVHRCKNPLLGWYVDARQQVALTFETKAEHLTTDVLVFSRHNFVTGDALRVKTSGTLPAPLVAGTTYYVIYVNSLSVKLATTLENANNGVAIDLTAIGTGYIDVLDNDLFSTSHDFLTGSSVSLISTGTLPAPLVSGTTYYAIYVDSTSFKLATSAQNAIDGVAITLTDSGTGLHHIGKIDARTERCSFTFNVFGHEALDAVFTRRAWFDVDSTSVSDAAADIKIHTNITSSVIPDQWLRVSSGGANLPDEDDVVRLTFDGDYGETGLNYAEFRPPYHATNVQGLIGKKEYTWKNTVAVGGIFASCHKDYMWRIKAYSVDTAVTGAIIEGVWNGSAFVADRDVAGATGGVSQFEVTLTGDFVEIKNKAGGVTFTALIEATRLANMGKVKYT